MTTKGSRTFCLWVLPLLVLLATGCTVARDTGRLEAVTEAGIAYAGKVPPLLDRAYELAAAVDSGALVVARSGLSAEQRRGRLQEFDTVMTERLKEYAAAKRHNDLLRSYFLAFRILLKPDGPKGIGAAAKRLTAELGKLSPQLKKARMGDVSVSGIIEPATRIVVASFRSAALAPGARSPRRGHRTRAGRTASPRDCPRATGSCGPGGPVGAFSGRRGGGAVCERGAVAQDLAGAAAAKPARRG